MADIPDRLSDSMARMARQVDETRQRMFEESQRARASLESMMATTRSFMDRAVAGAVGAAALTGGIAYAGAQQFSQYGPWGGATAVDMSRGVSRAALSAIGLSGGLSVFRPSPASGAYYSTPMDFGSAIYYAGFGQVISSLSGGLFGRSAGVGPGFNPALVESKARAELSLRLENIGNAGLSSIPFFGDRMFRFRDMEESTQQQAAQRLSFVRTGRRAGAEIGGVGFRADSSGIEAIAKGLGDELRSTNRARGFDMSDEEAQQIVSGAWGRFSPSDLERLVNRHGTTGVRDKIKQAAAQLSKVKMALNADFESINELSATVAGFMDGDSVGRFLAQSMSRGPLGGMTAIQVARQDAANMQAGRVLGLRGGGLLRYGRRRTNAAAALYEASIDDQNPLDQTTLSMYGGTGLAAGAAFSAQQSISGLQFGNTDPGMAALFQSNPAALARLNAGGSYLGLMQDQTFAQLRDPFASLKARYDPETQARMASEGDFAAYRAARAKVAFRASMSGGLMDPAAQRAAAIAEYQQSTGISDNMEAASRFGLYGDREAFFSEELGAAAGARAGGLMESLSRIMPSVSQRDVVDIMRSGEIGPNEDLSSLSPARVASLLGRRGATATVGASAEGEIRAFISDLGSRSGKFLGRGSELPNRGGRFGAVRTERLQAQLSTLMRSGYSASEINKVLSASGAGNQFRVAPDGTLQVWSSEGSADGNQRFVNAGDVSWAQDSVGGDAWNSDAFQGVIKALGDLGSRAGDQQKWSEIQTNMFEAMGASGDAFFAGVDGANVSDRVGSLLGSRSGGLRNRFQRDFHDRFSGGLTAKGLAASGLSDAKDALAAYYAHHGGSSDILKKIRGASSSADLSPIVEDVNKAGGDREVETWAALALIKRNSGALAQLAPKLGTELSPMWVQFKGSRPNGGDPH